MREWEFIDWIRSQTQLDRAAVPVGPGDDAAVVACGGEKVIVTTDQVLDGVHFKLAEHGPEAGGRKAMARNLSDVAAVAGKPLGAVVTVAFSKGFPREGAEAIYRGLRSVGDEFRCPIVGGDVGSWSGPLAISVTVLARPGGIEPVLRCEARAGDAVCVTGALGGAWKSRRHLTFTPRINEARTLASRCRLNAMIDVSDGLAADLWQICRASGVGADLEIAAIPIHPDLKGESPAAGLKAALGDGEDYELLFTLPPEEAERLIHDQPLGVRVSRIGAIVADKALTLLHPDARREPIEPAGWEHQI